MGHVAGDVDEITRPCFLPGRWAWEGSVVGESWFSVAPVDELSGRVSDSEREQTALALREHLLAGRLTLDEFSERVDMAYEARTAAEMAKAHQDLPQARVEPASRRKPTRLTTALFGDVERRGRLRLRGRSLAVSLFADLDLDLREAEVDGPETTVTVLAGFGNVDVYVPEGVDVDITGATVVGRRREWGRDLAHAAAPTIHVRTVGCFATIDVWRVPHQMRGSYGELIRQLRDQQRQLPR
jgi:uncharacterized protein DUF1707/cell wall-active antibiotic response 4TMS protein YvqF